MVRRGFLRKILLVAALVLIRPNTLCFIFGTATFLLGALLHLWTKGWLVRNDEVTTSGPYRFVRHPFYLANALLDAGICIIAKSKWIFMIYPILFVIAYGRTIRREEEYLDERHGEAWRAYRKRVPMIIPYRWPLPATPGTGFCWENLVREGELPRFIRLLAYPLVLHLWAQLLKVEAHSWHATSLKPWLVFGQFGVLNVIEALAIIALFTAAAILRKRLRPPAPPESPKA